MVHVHHSHTYTPSFIWSIIHIHTLHFCRIWSLLYGSFAKEPYKRDHITIRIHTLHQCGEWYMVHMWDMDHMPFSFHTYGPAPYVSIWWWSMSTIHIHTLRHSYGPSFTYIHHICGEWYMVHMWDMDHMPFSFHSYGPSFTYIHHICGAYVTHAPYVWQETHMSRTTHASTHDSLHRPPLWIM